MAVDEADQPPENILEVAVVPIGGLEPALDNFQLEDEVEVVLPESLYHVVLEAQLPLDVLELVDPHPQLGLLYRAVEGLICEVL